MATREIRSVVIKFLVELKPVCESESVRFAGCRPERYESSSQHTRLLKSSVVVVRRGICRYLFSVVVEVTKVRFVVRKRLSLTAVNLKVFRSSKDKVVVSLKISLQKS